MITQSELKELLHYDPDTGVFTRIVTTSSNARTGDKAGCLTKGRNTTYLTIRIDGYLYKAHRLAWLFMNGKFPDGQIDHIDGNGLNNRIINIRDVTNRENARNARLSNSNTSGTLGVCFDKQHRKWRAQIRTDSGRKTIGVFVDIQDAIDARKSVEVELGYHENHGRKS